MRFDPGLRLHMLPAIREFGGPDAQGARMTNTERLFHQTLPRWSGVTVIDIDEPLGDMWLRGARAAHHEGIPYVPDGIDVLRKELNRDFTGAPSSAALGEKGAVQTVADLDTNMERFQQRRQWREGELLRLILPESQYRLWGERVAARAPVVPAGEAKEKITGEPKAKAGKNAKKKGQKAKATAKKKGVGKSTGEKRRGRSDK
jgi:hypothetical protein